MRSILLLFVLFPLTLSHAATEDALIKAAVKGDVREIESLLLQGAPVDARNPLTGWTALTAAAYYGYPEIVRLLIDAGAEPNIHDKNGGTPLMKAVSLGPFEDRADIMSRKLEVVKLLLQAGADPTLRDRFGVRIWQMTMVDHLDEITQVFEDAGVQGIKEERFIEAVDSGNTDLARALLKKGVDVNAKNDDGISGWSEIMSSGNQNLVDLALQAGADVNADLGNGLRPLMVAVSRENVRQVRQLLDRGAQVNAFNANGRSALDIANETQNTEIQRILQSAAQAQ